MKFSGCGLRCSPITEQVALRMRASGELVPEIAKIISVSTPTMYRLLAERSKEAV